MKRMLLAMALLAMLLVTALNVGGLVTLRNVGAGPIITSTLSYSSVTGTNIALPVIYKNVYGGWTSGLNIMNTSNNDNYVFIQYYTDRGEKAGQLGIILRPHNVHRFTLLGSLMPDAPYSAMVTSQYAISIVVNTTLQQ